ncbi:hypothetical protein Sango_1918800 [Sesamum angolense]|uniref:Uncharacterized protein n=1 Tax=Sesamum angolense TaxID=2727404 RepID=A0AAE1WDM6_9LAMI|nr:hypothetical protein Sango_1918800 [Sesamum angolense]
MCHPSDVEMWKNFDRIYPDFLEKPRNVRLGLCTDDFEPHVIPGPSNLKRLIDVYLQPLIEELLQLWHVGVRIYDHAMDRAFNAGVNDVDCEQPTRLWNGDWVEYRGAITSRQRKASFRIFHTGQHFFTVMDIKGKIKDNMNIRRDLKIICNRPELELDESRLNIMPKAVYTLGKEQKRRVCEWIVA